MNISAAITLKTPMVTARKENDKWEVFLTFPRGIGSYKNTFCLSLRLLHSLQKDIIKLLQDIAKVDAGGLKLPNGNETYESAWTACHHLESFKLTIPGRFFGKKQIEVCGKCQQIV